MSVIHLEPTQGCSDGIFALAVVGGIVLAALIYLLIFFLIREIYAIVKGKKGYSELTRMEKENANIYSGFWIVTVPLTIVFGAIYCLYKWVRLPFVAAEKKDLREMETRINQKIILNGIVPPTQKSKFSVGDLITGIKENPGNYKHLNEGCVCKVLSIDEKGSMSVVLIDHKDFQKHTDVIGKVFKAPSRNFMKYPTKTTKKVKRR